MTARLPSHPPSEFFFSEIRVVLFSITIVYSHSFKANLTVPVDGTHGLEGKYTIASNGVTNSVKTPEWNVMITPIRFGWAEASVLVVQRVYTCRMRSRQLWVKAKMMCFQEPKRFDCIPSCGSPTLDRQNQDLSRFSHLTLQLCQPWLPAADVLTVPLNSIRVGGVSKLPKVLRSCIPPESNPIRKLPYPSSNPPVRKGESKSVAPSSSRFFLHHIRLALQLEPLKVCVI